MLSRNADKELEETNKNTKKKKNKLRDSGDASNQEMRAAAQCSANTRATMLIRALQGLIAETHKRVPAIGSPSCFELRQRQVRETAKVHLRESALSARGHLTSIINKSPPTDRALHLTDGFHVALEATLPNSPALSHVFCRATPIRQPLNWIPHFHAHFTRRRRRQRRRTRTVRATLMTRWVINNRFASTFGICPRIQNPRVRGVKFTMPRAFREKWMAHACIIHVR